MFSPLEQFDINLLYPLYNNTILDFSLTNLILPLVCLLLLFVLITICLWNLSFHLIPTIFQFILESLIIFVFSIVKQQIGRAGYVYFPLIYSLFQMILILNYFSMLPFGLALTSHVIIISWISLSICLSIFILGFLKHGMLFFKIFIPECPLVLLPILILIEIFSYIIRSFSLAIRLSANIMAGHTLVHIIGTAVYAILSVNFFIFIIGFIGLSAIILLELGVAFLQAYVFTILICIYLNDADRKSVV